MDTARHPITLAVEGGIAIVTLERPPVNAIDGARAAALGVVHQCVPRAELEAAARAQAERIAAVPSAALAACKRCITAAVDGREDGFEAEVQGTALLYAQAETQALVRKFLSG